MVSFYGNNSFLNGDNNPITAKDISDALGFTPVLYRFNFNAETSVLKLDTINGKNSNLANRSITAKDISDALGFMPSLYRLNFDTNQNTLSLQSYKIS